MATDQFCIARVLKCIMNIVVQICDLPKSWYAGQRKEVTVAGVSILLFWYRNDIFAIEAR